MSTEMKLYINNISDEIELGGVGADWTEVDAAADYFVFSAGSADVADGEAIPSDTDLNRAAVQLDAANPVNVSKCFLADVSANLLEEVINAGNQNKQYAFCVSLDGATASEPQLESWDNSDMDSSGGVELGGGTPANSWYKAICTNEGAPSADWTGTPLAGSGTSNVVNLNMSDGALAAAGDLYFNLKIVIPGGYLTPGLSTPIIVITYTTN